MAKFLREEICNLAAVLHGKLSVLLSLWKRWSKRTEVDINSGARGPYARPDMRLSLSWREAPDSAATTEATNELINALPEEMTGCSAIDELSLFLRDTHKFFGGARVTYGREIEAGRQYQALESLEERLADITAPEATISSGGEPESAGQRSSAIPNRAQKAFEQYQSALEALENPDARDREAYELIKGTFQKEGALDQLRCFATWQRNLREYRRLTRTQKNELRSGRAGESQTVKNRNLL
ncbi:MAG: hypothetical protein O7D91_10880 [Planctomycetota bacterium]|nr:hypothetical protein [Planctomycetota bacterium]